MQSAQTLLTLTRCGRHYLKNLKPATHKAAGFFMGVSVRQSSHDTPSNYPDTT